MPTTVTLYVSEAQLATWNEARAAAERENVSLSRFASDALEKYLAKSRDLNARARPILLAAIRDIEASIAASEEQKRLPKPPKAKSAARKGASK